MKFLFIFFDEDTFKQQYKSLVEGTESYANPSKFNIKNGLTVAEIVNPKQHWEYNHIVNYIRISVDGSDILFDVFLSNAPEEYCWWIDQKKYYFQNNDSPGLHFRFESLHSNEEIRQRIQEMLEDIMNRTIRKGYYVDTRAYDIVTQHLDYISMLESIQEERGGGTDF